jgi:hypothetical protein
MAIPPLHLMVSPFILVISQLSSVYTTSNPPVHHCAQMQLTTHSPPPPTTSQSHSQPPSSSVSSPQSSSGRSQRITHDLRSSSWICRVSFSAQMVEFSYVCWITTWRRGRGVRARCGRRCCGRNRDGFFAFQREGSGKGF